MSMIGMCTTSCHHRCSTGVKCHCVLTMALHSAAWLYSMNKFPSWASKQTIPHYYSTIEGSRRSAKRLLSSYPPPVMTLDVQVCCDKNGCLFSNCNRCAVRIRSNVSRSNATIYQVHTVVSSWHKIFHDIPATFKPCVPYTFSLGSTTPPSFLGFMAHVPICEDY